MASSTAGWELSLLSLHSMAEMTTPEIANTTDPPMSTPFESVTSVIGCPRQSNHKPSYYFLVFTIVILLMINTAIFAWWLRGRRVRGKMSYNQSDMELHMAREARESCVARERREEILGVELQDSHVTERTPYACERQANDEFSRENAGTYQIPCIPSIGSAEVTQSLQYTHLHTQGSENHGQETGIVDSNDDVEFGPTGTFDERRENYSGSSKQPLSLNVSASAIGVTRADQP